MASDHLIVVEKAADFRWAASASRVVTAEEFISERAAEHDRATPASARRLRKVINLRRSYDHMSLGYYCSLLAEARGDRITPSVETILDFQQRSTQPARTAILCECKGTNSPSHVQGVVRKWCQTPNGGAAMQSHAVPAGGRGLSGVTGTQVPSGVSLKRRPFLSIDR